MIKLFGDDSYTTGSKPFFNEWIGKNPDKEGAVYSVTKIVASKKGNGYLVHTDDFILFLWKNNEVTRMLIEAVMYYSEVGVGPRFVACIRNSSYALGIDEDNESFFTSHGGTWSISLLPEEEDTTPSPPNPFMAKGDGIPQMNTHHPKKKKPSKPPTSSLEPSQGPSS